MIELLSPVGNWSMLTAAKQACADAVYFGIKGFNMRAAAQNFSLEELPNVVQFCHNHNLKAYCTINIIIYQHELEKLDQYLNALKQANIDAIICWDLAVIKKCRELGLEIHLSTQASVSNSQAAKLYQDFGVTRIVLARECSMEDIQDIKNKTNLELETFIHGARCISLSGRCFMSQELFNKSANRGECLQSCRREYTVFDDEGKQMKVENNFIMSAKDLCTLPILDKLVKLNINCFKIEGRNRPADYVFKVTQTYRQALDAINTNTFTEELQHNLMQQLQEVYNKEYSTGFFVDYPHHERCNIYGNKSTVEKVLLGKVSNFYNQQNVVEFKLDNSSLKLGHKLAFIGPTTGYVEYTPAEIHTNNSLTTEAKQGEIITLKLPQKVRINDQVYLLKPRNSTH
ncbi:U32 family peptidase [Candidatus Woesearchaeota archaeon]|nr:U32 family peptidase [Candidatus Woesearchaeota archaeon]